MTSVRKQDEQFGEFYRHQWKRLVAAIATSLPGVDAEDVAQEAFIRAYGSWSRVASHPSPDGWLFLTAFRIGRRASWRRRRRGDLPWHTSTMTEDVVEDRLLARSVLDAATTRQRAAIVLRFYFGLSVRETASLLKCREGTVKSLVNRGLSAVAESQGTADHAKRGE